MDFSEQLLVHSYTPEEILHMITFHPDENSKIVQREINTILKTQPNKTPFIELLSIINKETNNASHLVFLCNGLTNPEYQEYVNSRIKYGSKPETYLRFNCKFDIFENIIRQKYGDKYDYLLSSVYMSSYDYKHSRHFYPYI